jgi:hypothetical protein
MHCVKELLSMTTQPPVMLREMIFPCLCDKLDLLVSTLHVPFRAITLSNKTARNLKGVYLVISKPT